MTTTSNDMIYSVLDNNLSRIADIKGAVLLSNDGIMLSSYLLDRPQGERIAAASSGIASTMKAISGDVDGGRVIRQLVEMEDRYLCIVGCGEGSTLIVVTSRKARLGELGGEAVRTAQALGEWLSTPGRGQAPTS
ncbi:roadblock/LC7 domain-containing protein [Streptomyces tirandamycinicus]|uniref:Roadblock/LC7 domain-containing protein n=1 Tax=Streptomyces tirandamycinicus TaxID=2174846 RepID=A0A2S1T020_9ACTN|nr:MULTISPECIES: roadblock/LC7 domain-containing protein [Streptomyces]AWI32002.1 roadblock/LC7 domain-containing protein [Streptomyces tirandamycinicus]MCY0982622.1 roadblock/LC7 domain-containing protein [Streptomyces tirandamycinicus]NNJ07414.1 roadblock/LC7 domain-containing protein [Streptomyces sp. PKU-MA01144]TFE42667.1 roadblock/LC7 domain-containing protein [Streptomyces sp. ICN441]